MKGKTHGSKTSIGVGFAQVKKILVEIALWKDPPRGISKTTLLETRKLQTLKGTGDTPQGYYFSSTPKVTFHK
jgi:hypothetical protein